MRCIAETLRKRSCTCSCTYNIMRARIVHASMCGIIISSVQDVTKIASVLMGVDWEELAGWLDLDDTTRITTQCKVHSLELALCYRKKLVEFFCDHTGKSTQEVAKVMARVLEDENCSQIAAIGIL